MIDKFFKVVTSLKLTVVCLSFAMILVFVGTVAQVDLGLYQAQEKYFRSLFVYWSPGDGNLQIPILPGGYLLGTVLLINLISAHFKRFHWARKKSGIYLTHIGLIVLLLGQFFTEIYQVESAMRLTEGFSKNYTESYRDVELAVVDKSDPESDKVITFPRHQLKAGEVLRHDNLPFEIKVESYYGNSEPSIRAPVMDPAPPELEGLGKKIAIKQQDLTHSMDSRNIASMEVRLSGEGLKPQLRTLSVWFSDEALVKLLHREFNRHIGGDILQPQTFQVDYQSYEIALRPKRYYKPYSIELIDFKHDKYIGTEIPKNYSSEIRLVNPQTQEEREVLIYMNNPLRYGGETFYQASFDENDDRVSVLQVVRNPSWLLPYVSCILVGVGLTIQFGIHFIGFIKKRRARG